MMEWWGPVLVEYYGTTESGVVTTIGSEGWIDKPGSVGRPVPPTKVVVVGPDGEELPSHHEGRIFFCRPHGRGFSYHNAPDDTRAAHLAPGLFTCGDMGYLDNDGFLFLTGRSADRIVSGGVNVSAAEVEEVLLAHSAVADAAVFGVPDEEFGERVKAVVALVPGAITAAGDVREILDLYCRERLAGYKVPRSYEVVSSLPREPSGKLRKHLLRNPTGGMGSSLAQFGSTAS
jgi:acyl-CoA synthetase (AMP-forming)/AMP-acid ligase II